MLRVLLLLCACALMVGCMSDPACERQIALMRAELLDLEDRYALLQAKYEDATGQCLTPGTPLPSDRPSERATPSREAKPPAEEAPAPDRIEIQIDPEDLSSSQGASPPVLPADTDPVGTGVRFQPPSVAERAGTAEEGTIRQVGNIGHPEGEVVRHVGHVPDEAARDSARPIENTLPQEVRAVDLSITAISLAGEADADVADGFELEIVPRDAQQQACWIPGDLSIAVIDPSEEDSDRQRIGTWRLAWEDLMPQLDDNQAGVSARPLRLPLTWNFNQPRNTELLLLVRFEPHGHASIEREVPLHLDRSQVAADEERLEEALDSLMGDALDRQTGLPEWRPNR